MIDTIKVELFTKPDEVAEVQAGTCAGGREPPRKNSARGGSPPPLGSVPEMRGGGPEAPATDEFGLGSGTPPSPTRNGPHRRCAEAG